MKCPFCQSLDNKVVDSRLTKDNTVIRRRRECLTCTRRFTTYENVEEMHPYVIKRDGRRQPYDRQKVFEGLRLACQKRPVSVTDLDEFIDAMEAHFREAGLREIPAQEIGERVVGHLKALDDVAYVRFASVYRRFKDLGEFMDELQVLLEDKQREGKAAPGDKASEG
ncbi:MAG: transcriptional regulator NrdR [Proteobacteria bacterium]|nr:transcriptional regulator NrdR [Pseudomonadota bacterium]MBU1742944.1 transcriptional regulator NrdR [Pseudomonadota bacterium]